MADSDFDLNERQFPETLDVTYVVSVYISRHIRYKDGSASFRTTNNEDLYHGPDPISAFMEFDRARQQGKDPLKP